MMLETMTKRTGKMWRGALGLACLLAGMMTSQASQAQSFNCRLARAADEILVCQDEELSRLDERMAALYFGLRNQASSPVRAEMEAEQADWRASRRVCGRDRRCIRAAYGVRIDELSRR